MSPLSGMGDGLCVGPGWELSGTPFCRQGNEAQPKGGTCLVTLQETRPLVADVS